MAVTVASLKAILSLDKEQFEKGLAGAKAGLSSLGKGLATGAIAGAGAGIAAVGAGMAATGVAAFDLATDIDQATRDIQGSLGITGQEAEKLGEVATNVFANNFGGTVQEAAKAVAELKKQMPGLEGQELQDATENAFKLSDAFDADLDKSINASSTLMKEFGLTQQEAFDFLATGFQRGLDSSGDFLDSVGEYSNLFAQNGFAAEEFFSTMETGMAGGVLGTDKIADAFKEAGIKIQELDDDMLDSLEMIGVNVDAMFQGLQDGEVTVADAINKIIPAIQSMENPIQRNAMGVKIFGTQWEDLGQQIVAGVDTGKTGLEEMAGATEALNAQYESLGQMGAELWRELLVALQPAADEFLRLAQEVMPILQEMMVALSPVIEEFAVKFGDTLGPAIEIIVNAINDMIEGFTGANSEMSGMDMVVQAVATALDLIVVAVQATAVAFHLVAPLIKSTGEAVRALNGFIDRGVRGWWEAADALQAMADAAGDFISKNTGLGSGAGTALNVLSGGTFGAVQGLLGFATGGIVPGQMGQPQLAVVHGGETIIPVGGNNAPNINITVGSVSASGSGDVDEAIRMTMDILRSQLMRATG